MMEVLEVKHAKYNGDGTISALVKWSGKDEEDAELHPFLASPADVEEHGRVLFEDLVAGKFGAVAKYTTEDERHDKRVANIAELSRLIAEADDVIRPLSDERDAEVISDGDLKRWKAWVKYRKALRELDVESVADVKWPSQPQ